MRDKVGEVAVCFQHQKRLGGAGMFVHARRANKTPLAMNAGSSIVFRMVTHFDALLKLPENERMEVAEMLWLSVADEKTLPVSAEHKRIIDERLKRYRSGQSEPVPHSEMMKRLRRK